ncbi:hypothetical protein ACJJI5_12320 [Microbulbifer sp. EKSA008]|uniref:hypothetical protein n=1 Tax=Microbulbifer sp. EKSA008 TaxID=3243367 RepID=UPI004041E378
MSEQKDGLLCVQLIFDRSEYERLLAVTKAVRDRRPVSLSSAEEALQALHYGLRAAKPLGK